MNNSEKNIKKLKIELDIYERNYVTINNLKVLRYSENYVYGFLKNLPNIKDDYSVYYKECMVYIRKLLLLFDRIKGLFELFIKTEFDRLDIVKIYWKILEDFSLLKDFLYMNDKLKKVVEEKLNSFEKDLSAENFKEYKKYIPFKNLNCIKYRISHT
jgi:hypothetical protein